MDADEFRRRIAVYVERDLPELSSQRNQIAHALSDDLWPMVGRWLEDAQRRGDLLDWLDERIRQECPQGYASISTLKIRQSGADNGPLRHYGRP